MSDKKSLSAREELKRLVIMGCHPECKTYEEALKKEWGRGCGILHLVRAKDNPLYESILITGEHLVGDYLTVLQSDGKIATYPNSVKLENSGLPITIGRVMQALGLNYILCFDSIYNSGSMVCGDDMQMYGLPGEFITHWVLGINRESTDTDQTDETIEALLKILKS